VNENMFIFFSMYMHFMSLHFMSLLCFVSLFRICFASVFVDRSSDPHLYRKYIVFASKRRYLIAIEKLVFLI
jgi:hypothetical protein